VTPAVTYTVGRGDSLSRIAVRNHTSVAELMKVNHLRNSSVLSIGQKLLIPGKAPARVTGGGYEGEATPVSGATYTVRSGDTLAAIAHRAGMTNAELKRLNHLRSDYVQVGRVLKLPNGSSVAAAQAANNSSDGSSPRSSSVRTPEGALTHEVRPGETIGAIARKYHVRAQDLLVANNIADPRKIRVGQTLVIPGGAAPGGSSSTTASKAAADEGSGVGPSQAPAAGAAAAAAGSDSSSGTAQDLDAGLKPQADVPVLKVDDSSGSNTQ
jgi:LysM repeat protein